MEGIGMYIYLVDFFVSDEWFGNYKVFASYKAFAKRKDAKVYAEKRYKQLKKTYKIVSINIKRLKVR